MKVRSEIRDAIDASDLIRVRSLFDKCRPAQEEMNGALFWACVCNRLEIARFIAGQGANIHSRENYAVRRAASLGDLETLHFFMKLGANIYDRNGQILLSAGLNGHVDVVKYLVERGVSAEGLGNQDFVRLILKGEPRGLHVLLSICPHIQPQSLIETAVENNAIACAKVLLELGAKPNLRLKMSDEMKDLFISHQQKTTLSHKIKSVGAAHDMELGL